MKAFFCWVHVPPGLLKLVRLTEFDKPPTLKLSQDLQIHPLVDSHLDRHP